MCDRQMTGWVPARRMSGERTRTTGGGAGKPTRSEVDREGAMVQSGKHALLRKSVTKGGAKRWHKGRVV